MNAKLVINAQATHSDEHGLLWHCDMELPNIGWIAWKWMVPPERTAAIESGNFDDEKLRAAQGALATGRFLFSPNGIPQLVQ